MLAYNSQGNYTIRLTVTNKIGLESNSLNYTNVTLKQNNEKVKETPGFEVF